MVGLSSKEWETLRAWMIAHRDGIHAKNWTAAETAIAIRKSAKPLYIVSVGHVREMARYTQVRFRDDAPPDLDPCVAVKPKPALEGSQAVAA